MQKVILMQHNNVVLISRHKRQSTAHFDCAGMSLVIEKLQKQPKKSKQPIPISHQKERELLLWMLAKLVDQCIQRSWLAVAGLCY